MQKRIMVVDDDEMVLKLCETLLNEKGYEVVLMPSGKRCVSYLHDRRNRRVDLIILDIEMPFLNGFNTLSSIRQSESLKNIPVMFLTSVATEENVREAVRLGVNSYVKKPFSPQGLLEKVETFF